MDSRLQSNEIHIPKPEFDLTSSAAPCEYFKSSFARSLSFTNTKAKSLDFSINFGLAKNNGPSSIIEESPAPSPPRNYCEKIKKIDKKSSNFWNDMESNQFQVNFFFI